MIGVSTKLTLLLRISSLTSSKLCSMVEKSILSFFSLSSLGSSSVSEISYKPTIKRCKVTQPGFVYIEAPSLYTSSVDIIGGLK